MVSKADEPVEIQVDAQGRVTASATEVTQVDETCALAIGRFIVAFANLEHWTHFYPDVRDRSGGRAGETRVA